MDVLFFLDKTKLFAIKENEIVLQGDRNMSDGLWDILVYKRLLSENNWITPPLHPALYPLRENSKPTCNSAFSQQQQFLYLQENRCKYKENDVFTKQ